MSFTMSVRQQMYQRLPEAWIFDDEQLGQPLWAWLYWVLGDAEAVCATINRYADGELTDPALALPEELEWLAWLSGIPYPTATMTVPAVRTWMVRPNRLERGSHRTMAETVALHLTSPSTSIVQVFGLWRGNPWIVVVRTAQADTPPTGVPVSTWDDLVTIAPTWTDLEYDGADDDIHLEDSVRVLVAKAWAGVEKPAGVRMGHRWLSSVADLAPTSFYQYPAA